MGAEELVGRGAVNLSGIAWRHRLQRPLCAMLNTPFSGLGRIDFPDCDRLHRRTSATVSRHRQRTLGGGSACF
jgi:hypothetical protein